MVRSGIGEQNILLHLVSDSINIEICQLTELISVVKTNKSKSQCS